MTMIFFYYFIQKKALRNESNLIEAFKLLRILNFLKISITSSKHTFSF